MTYLRLSSFFSCLFVLLLSLPTYMLGQTCTPEPLPTTGSTPYFYPLPDDTNGADPTLGITEDVCVNQYFEYPLTLVLTDFLDFQGTPLDITDATVTGVTGLPTGMTYNCNPPSCSFPDNSLGCILLYGTPVTQGDYIISIDMVVNFNSIILPNVTISYPDPLLAAGEYVLTVNTTSCQLAPVAGFSSAATSICATETVSFTDQSTNSPTSWDWSFPGGTPSSSTAQNPTVTYNAAGNYDVALTATNAIGSNTSAQNDYIAVQDDPTAQFSHTLNGLTVVLNNTSANATSYQWSFGDGNTSTLSSPTHTYGADGTYTIQLIATNSCGSQSSSVVINTNPMAPTANFTSSTPTGCVPFNVSFSDASLGSPTSYLWSFPGGTPSSSTSQFPFVTYNTAGTYDVSLIVSSALGSDTLMQLAYVEALDQLPVPSFTYVPNNLTVTFTNTSMGNADSYSWDFGTGNTSTLASPTFTFLEAGTYTVVLTAFNACGSQSFPQTISVGQAAIPEFTSNIVSGCAPTTIVYTDQSANSPTSWSWSFPGGNPSNSTAQNPTVVYATAGTYDVSLTASNGLGGNTETKASYVDIRSTPLAGFSFSTNNAAVNFTNISQGATSYTWDFGDGFQSTLENPSHNYSAAGTYTVVLTATNDCGTGTSSQLVQITMVNIHEPESLSDLQVLPNPNGGIFWLRGDLPLAKDLEISLYSLDGKMLTKEVISPNGTRVDLPISLMARPSGVYLMMLKTEEDVVYRKVVVK